MVYMKLTSNQVKRIIHHILREIKNSSAIEAKEDDQKVALAIEAEIHKNMREEVQLDQEVETMMDQLENQNPGGFQRYKMFPLLKKKLAEKKGFVL